jgi:hypothetical protein
MNSTLVNLIYLNLHMINMNKEVLVMIYLNKEGSVEVEMNLDEIGQVAVLGILEQIKYNILSNTPSMKRETKYDA